MPDIFDQVDTSESMATGDIFDQIPTDENWIQTAARYLGQLPSGALRLVTWPLDSMVGLQEQLKEDEIEHYESLGQKRPEGFFEAVKDYLPTHENITNLVEEKAGLPVKAKTPGQKYLNLAAMVAASQSTIPQAIKAGTAAAATSAGLQTAGVPEHIAELPAMIVGGGVGEYNPSVSKATKPSGIPKRRFEKISEPHEISEKKMDKINKALETDFKEASNKIIKESPVGETAKNLVEDPSFKAASKEFLNEAQKIADAIDIPITSKTYKESLAKEAKAEAKGFKLGESEKVYFKNIKEALEEISDGTISAGQLVEQYRKNNADLSEYFEPGRSKAFNRGKRDALLTQNRAIANTIESQYPNSNLSPVFKEGNARWTKIKDVEAIDTFVEKVFGEKVNFKQMKDFFNDANYQRIFKRSLGEEGFKNFETLMKDMLTSEKPYKMLQVAKAKGWGDLYGSAITYMVNPKLGSLKSGLEAAKGTYKWLINSMLDKPQLAYSLKRGVDSLKAGDFKEAEKQFNKVKEVQAEVLPAEGKTPEGKTPEISEPIEIKDKTKESPRDASIKGFKDFNLDGYLDDAIYNGFVEKLGDVPQYLRKNHKARVERLEAELGKSLENIIDDIYDTDLASKPKSTPKEQAKPESKTQEKGDISNIGSMGDAITHNFYEAVFESLEKGNNSVSGVKDPFLQAAKPAYEAGQIKSVDDLKAFAKFYEQAKKNQSIAKPPEKPRHHLTHKDEGVKAAVERDQASSEHDIKEGLEFRDRFMNQRKALDTRDRQHKPKEMPKKTSIKPKDKLQDARENYDFHSEALKNLEKEMENADPSRKRYLEQQIFMQKDFMRKYAKIIEESERIEKANKLDAALEKSVDKKKTTPKEKPPQTLTQPKIEQLKHQDITKKGLKTQKDWLTVQIEDALKNPSKYDQMDKILFDVPGDGQFNINNNVEALEKFKTSVENKWPDKAIRATEKKAKDNAPTQAEYESAMKLSKKETPKPKSEKSLTQPKTENLTDFKKNLVKQNPSLKIGIKEDGKDLIISTFLLPESQRGKGTGTKILKQITDHADATKKTIYLSPKSASFKKSDDLRIESFYKRHGFKENKNRDVDGYPKELMVRKPQKINELELEKYNSEKPAQSLTQPKIEQLKRQDITKKGLKTQKDWLTVQIEDALNHPNKYDQMDKILFDVPGDGQFNINNNVQALEKFKSSVEKKWPDKAIRATEKKAKDNAPTQAEYEEAMKSKKEFLPKDLEFVEDKFNKIIQIDKKISQTEKTKDLKLSASLIGEGRQIDPSLRKGNIRKQNAINKLEVTRLELFKKIHKKLEGYSKEQEKYVWDKYYHSRRYSR